jgi:branched-chain amino acid transport system ATP-binding protein
MTVTPGMATAAPETVLELRGVNGGYDRTKVLYDINLTVPKGSVVALLGANGAGKTTLLRIASGILRPTTGSVLVRDHDVTREAPHVRARRGLCHIPEGRAIFRALSVRDNLELAIPPWSKQSGFDAAIDVFPALGKRLSQTAGSMSGGEQQMLALGRAFLADPAVVLADEVSMGLAPLVVNEIFESLKRLAQLGVSLLLVEQYVNRALDMADTVYLLRQGRVTFTGPASEVQESSLTNAYMGVDAHTGEPVDASMGKPAAGNGPAAGPTPVNE